MIEFSQARWIMRVFVYGTLKRGERNHDRFCRGVLQVEQATMWGRLYHLPVGYPMLVVPPPLILALGTGDYLADEQTELRLSRELETSPRTADTSIAGDWLPIAGEILTFDDPATRFPKLDRLEQFVPGGKSFYDRVLVQPLPPAIGAVWTYIATGGRLPEGAACIGDRWISSQ